MTMTTTTNQIALVNVFVEAGVPVLLWGEPGTAKSASVESLARALARHCETVIASLREPADFGGLPVITPEGVRFAAPAWAKRIAAAQSSLLFLDEVNLAAPATQGALMRVVLDRVVGDEKLGAGVSIVAAANPPECSAGGWDLSAPLANRFAHVDWQPAVEDWVNGMLGGFPEVEGQQAPAGWESRIPEFAALVASYIRATPDSLHALPKDGTGKAWPSRRSWTNAARALACAASMGYGIRSTVAADVVISLVGEGAAAGFVTFAQTADLPNPEEALANPTTIALPTRDDRTGVFLDAVVACALATGKRTLEQRGARYAAAGVILDRVVASGRADLAVPAGTTLAKNRDKSWPLPASFARIIPLMASAGILPKQA
jgi:hypothetical protein